MAKKHVVIIVIALIVMIIYSLSSRQEAVSIQEGIHEQPRINKSAKRHLKTNNKLILLTKPIQEISIDKDYITYDKCGSSLDLFLQKYDMLDLSLIKEDERKHIEKTLLNCEKWFSKLLKMSEEEKEKLKINFDKKKEIITKMSATKHERNVIKYARKEIYSKDLDISFVALVYLLQNDYDFQKQIAKQMGILDINYLRFGMKLPTLFICQRGADCSAHGYIMQGLCTVTEAACNTSYISWLLSREITSNLYNDYIDAIYAIDKILGSDWFEKNPDLM